MHFNYDQSKGTLGVQFKCYFIHNREYKHAWNYISGEKWVSVEMNLIHVHQLHLCCKKQCSPKKSYFFLVASISR